MLPVYFDYNATTPLDSAVKAAMLPYLDEIFGNPSSVHQIGVRARAHLDEQRDRLAHLWKSKPSEVVFTSGGTESNNLAIFGVTRMLKSKGRHLITSSIEHHAALHCFQYLQKKEGFEVTYLPVDSTGRISPDDLVNAIRPDTVFASLMAANNETGTIQPVAELGSICQEHGVLFHTDAAQWIGKEPFTDIRQFNANLVSVCAHKFHGPKGSGALYIQSPLLPDPILFGGGHENERRAGTENMVAIAGLVEAFAQNAQKPVFNPNHLKPLTEQLLTGCLTVPGVHFRGSYTQRLANTISVTVEGCDGISLMAGLDLEGICASSGSACSAGSLEPSHVMTAMGVEPNQANALVRFSLGRDSTAEQVAYVCDRFPVVVMRIRA
ncbi:MAG TPA: cysteine desulfurase family protein [Verrucomicrobiae bacterium]